jgi:hypothetical protein
MPTISNTSFNVKFDLDGTPTLVLTDTTTAPPAGLVGIFEIIQPDGYVRTGNISSPDIPSAGSSFSFILTLDSSGQVQRGSYTIKYTAAAPGYISTDFTRTFQFQYAPVVLNLIEEFDVFTPKLEYIDSTVYQVSNYNNTNVVRIWTAVSIPTGIITSTAATFDIKYNNKYWDAYYTITLSAQTLYTHQVYPWLTVEETITKTINTYAETPKTLLQIVVLISSLKTKIDQAVDTVSDLEQVIADFDYAQSLFVHIIDKLKVSNLANIDRDLKDLLAVLHNYQIPAYVPTNLEIPPYNWSAYNTVSWGNITGSIQNQTDLWNILQSLTIQNNYVHDQQVASATWVITHNMGKKPSVSIVDTADDEIIAEVKYNSNNQLTLSFSAPVSGKAYLN